MVHDIRRGGCCLYCWAATEREAAKQQGNQCSRAAMVVLVSS